MLVQGFLDRLAGASESHKVVVRHLVLLRGYKFTTPANDLHTRPEEQLAPLPWALGPF